MVKWSILSTKDSCFKWTKRQNITSKTNPDLYIWQQLYCQLCFLFVWITLLWKLLKFSSKSFLHKPFFPSILKHIEVHSPVTLLLLCTLDGINQKSTTCTLPIISSKFAKVKMVWSKTWQVSAIEGDHLLPLSLILSLGASVGFHQGSVFSLRMLLLFFVTHTETNTTPSPAPSYLIRF